MEMVDLNVKALHILTKLFLLEFKEKNCGKILNVASAAGFMPEGPMLSTYYATKAYVLS
ncbi:MAG: SDR family NAD(P)-dependent oxidoreductase, partial [Clostridia bacterium]|nr:SDR family NAD(P)-dependent oxidoreductase [Clostridia bacterium]